MSFRQIITITTLEGRSEEFAEAAKQRMEAVKDEPGCLQFEIFRSLQRPEVFSIHERWVDQAAWEHHEELNKPRGQMGAGTRKPDPTRERYIDQD